MNIIRNKKKIPNVSLMSLVIYLRNILIDRTHSIKGIVQSYSFIEFNPIHTSVLTLMDHIQQVKPHDSFSS
jgi:hypothetical protein